MIKKIDFVCQCLHGIFYYATIILPVLAGVHMALDAAITEQKRSKVK